MWRAIDIGLIWRPIEEMTCSRPTTSTFSVAINPSAFDSFFQHEATHGARLTLVQRSTIVALHSLNIRNDAIAYLTHCDQRTIQHWIEYYHEHQSLDPRSSRPRVTSEATDTLIAAPAIETPITAPRTYWKYDRSYGFLVLIRNQPLLYIEQYVCTAMDKSPGSIISTWRYNIRL